ncbi:MAG: GumC family protein [Armatimonadota bacterium]
MEDRMQPINDAVDGAGSRNLLTIFRRRLWVMLPVAALIFMVAVMYALVQPRMYEASAWMLVSGGETKRGSEELLTEADIWRSLQSDISVHIRLIRRAEMAARVREQLSLDLPTYALVQHIDVEKVPGASANLISLTYRSTSPKQAQSIANAWGSIYEEDSRQRSTGSTVSAIDYVKGQIDTVESDLRDMEEQMAELEQEYLDTGVNIAAKNGGARVIGILDQLAQNRVEMEAIRAQIERTQKRLEEEPREVEEVEVQPSHRAQAIEQQLSRLHVELQKKLQDYYEDSPEVLALREQINRLEEQLGSQSEMTRSAVTTAPNPVYMNAQDTLIQLYGDLDALRARQSALQKQLAEEKRLEEMVPEGNIRYNELMRKVTGLQEVHSTLLSRLYDLQLKKATAIAPVQLVREAEEPRTPVSPKYETILGIGFVAALLFAAFAAVIVDQIDDTFADPDEIRDVLGERLIGVLPEIEAAEPFALQVGGNNSAERTAYANAVRMLASTVRIEMSDENASSLTITSSGRAEGKTLIAANLAAALAGAGERVLLVDADLHRPRLHGIFDLEKDPGLSNLLVGDMKPDDVIQPTHIANLSLVAAGPLPPSPVDLLASAHGQEVITELSQRATYVVWDTPPGGFLPDATVISHSTDKTLFVVGRQARRGASRETLGNLRELGVDIIGLCANRVRPVGGSYYYYYYYYYYDYYRDSEEPEDIEAP